MKFGMTIFNQNMETEQIYDTDSLMPYIKIEDLFWRLMMLRHGLIHLTMIKMIKDCFQ